MKATKFFASTIIIPAGGRISNILLANPRFEVMRHDITMPLYVEVDEIYNLACPASPVHYQFDPVQTLKTSVHGAINMLGLAKRIKAKIFQASTSEVYGDPQVHPQPESYWGHVNPLGSRACYDEGKRAAETLFFDYHRQHGVRIKVARIFNTYGPRMHPNDGRVVSNFIMQALRGEPITIYGDGTQTRSFGFVDDLIEGFWRMMSTDEAILGPINFGNPNEISVLELAEMVIAMTGSRSPAGIQAAAGRRSEATAAGYFAWRAKNWTGRPRSSCATASGAPSTTLRRFSDKLLPSRKRILHARQQHSGLF